MKSTTDTDGTTVITNEEGTASWRIPPSQAEKHLPMFANDAPAPEQGEQDLRLSKGAADAMRDVAAEHKKKLEREGR